LILTQNTIPCGSTSHFYAHFTAHDSYTCEYYFWYNHHVCLIEEIIDDIDYEDPEIECFTQDHDDLDFDRLIGQENDLYEPSLEDPDMEYFAPSGGYFDFSEPLQHDELMFEPMYELIWRTWSWNVSLSMEET
jgi:hypothetical protein